jgi:hypothetical protein
MPKPLSDLQGEDYLRDADGDPIRAGERYARDAMSTQGIDASDAFFQAVGWLATRDIDLTPSELAELKGRLGLV